MKLKLFFLLLLLCLEFKVLSGQISPGKLSRSHTHLEGINNCTQCHTLGEAVTNEKCLHCHSLLNDRIKDNKGYHASLDVKGKSCITCHSEHHGVNFEMIRFDKNNFDHNKTAYELKGAHKKQDCASCHKDERIKNVEIIKLNRTYLGLSTQCVSCHEDKHQGTLGNNCSACHDFEHFKPASGFNHNKTKFPLSGAHTNVKCISCHTEEVRNEKTFQKFAGIKFNSCVSCHKDEHQSRYGSNCVGCHQESSFNKLRNKIVFNHSLTGFVLEGKHKQLDCKTCHDQRIKTAKQLKEFSSISEVSCLNCHNDPHEGKFGVNCKDCHNQESFRINKELNNFDHTTTGFPLTGRHLAVSCKKCHVNNMTEPIKHHECMDCHFDFHKGQFTSDLQKKDCSVCHNTEGFGLTSYSLEEHKNSNFPLEGAHQAIACNECHFKNNEWKFKPISSACIQCHKDIHEGHLEKKFYESNQCRSCHTSEAWNKISFDHSITKFSLVGKHLDVQCSACHFVKNKDGTITQTFKNLNIKCAGCHDNIHGKQFETEGITSCERCHTTSSWYPELFDHNSARFKIDGAHVKVECKSCHKPEELSGNTITLFRNGKLDCKDCHM